MLKQRSSAKRQYIAENVSGHPRARFRSEMDLRKLLPALALMLLAAPVVRPQSKPEFRIEQFPVAGGAELLTVLGTIPGQSTEVPILSVLRDTLGDQDPENDRLRYV